MKNINRHLLLLFASLWIISAKASIALSFTKQDVSCHGGSNGSINLNVSGGTPPYSFSWSNGANTQNVGGLSLGIYSVTVTDNAGLSATLSVGITQPLPISTTINITNVTCGGGSNGAIDLSVSGGTPPYSYIWSNGTTTQDLINITAATYYVTITDNKGCVKIDSANVIQPQGILLSKTVTNVTCASGANGAINLTVTNGVSPFSYIWSNGATTEDLSGIAAGNYSVTVTDATGCSASTTATVGQTGSGMSINHTATQPSCYNGSNGSITITSVVGSLGPYTYLWSNGATTATNNNLTSGTYSVTATSSTGCTATKTITIGQPTQLTVILNIVPVTCFGGNNGAINSSPSGGTAPYSYSWSHGAFTKNVTGLTSGSYSLTVTDSKGCTATATAFVPQPLALTATATPSPLACTGGPTGSVITSVSGGTGPYTYLWNNGNMTPKIINTNAGNYSVTVTDGNGCTATASATIPPYTPMTTSSTQTNVLCHGGNNGSIQITVTNGKSPFTFNWSNGATTQNISGLTAGTYTVTVTDNNNCTTSRTVTITQPPFPFTYNLSHVNPTCNGQSNGSIQLTPLNGTSPYTYNWNDGPGGAIRTGLAAGTYSFTITDNVGCTTSGSITLTQPSPIVINNTVQHVTCFGGNNGSIQSSVSGGLTPYTFSWNNGQTTANISGLSASTYTLTVTDQSACTSTVAVNVNQPQAIQITLTPTAVSCASANNGAIHTSVTGGTGGYSYLWNDGVTSQHRSTLSAGTYSVTVTDNNACTASQSVNITAPTPIIVTSTVTNVACNGGNTGAITLSVNGGTAPYQFNWGGGITTQNRTNLSAGSYTVTVTDNAGCTTTHSATVGQNTTLNANSTVTHVSCHGGNNGAINISVNGGTPPYSFNWGGGITTQNRTNLSAGNYTVTITDNAGCTITNTSAVNQPAPITIMGNVTNVVCAGGNTGAINVSVSGGTPGYLFNWNNGATSQNLTAVSSGNYTLTVTDQNTCTASNSFSVTQSTSLQVNLTVTHITCNGAANGAINSSVSGGTIPYQYNWGGGIQTPNRTSLTAGNYTLTVTDNAGCTGTASATVQEPPALQVNLTKTDVTCNGGNNGAIQTTVTGGSGNYSYNWGGGITTQNRTNLTAGAYSVTVTDGNGCTATNGVAISQPAALIANISKTDVTCHGLQNGSVTLQVNGGTLGYNFSWNNGATTQNLNGVGAGSYTVTITDANSCTAVASTVVTQPASIQASISTTDVSCHGGTNGAINLTVTGGAGGFSFLWSNTAQTEDLTSVGAGTYSVTITDANGCTASASSVIQQPSEILVNTNITNITCNGAANGSITAAVSGGTPPYSYLWSNGNNTTGIQNLTPGSYSLTVTDNNGCTMLRNMVVQQPAVLSVSLTKGDVSCHGGMNGFINTNVSGGTAPYNYWWMDGVQTPNRINLTAATYSITVTDINGCSASATTTIQQPTQIVISVTKTNVSCHGAFTGSIITNTTGGSGAYTYLWSNGNNTQHLTSVQAGTYTLTVTDNTGCTASRTEVITQPLPITLGTSVQNVTCHGGSNGSISITPSGGNGGYVFNWSNGATTGTINNLSAGSYTLFLSDSLGCSTTLSLTVSQPTAIVLTPTPVHVSCHGGNNGSVNLNATGGTPNYTFLWSNGSTSKNLTNISAGSYTVTATDVAGCTVTATVSIQQPAALVATATPGQIQCFGTSTGSITLQVSGGTTPYNFTWSNNATTQNLTNIPAGNYSVVVTDNAGCTASASAIVTQSNAIIITLNKTDVTCFGLSNGSIQSAVNGGNAPLSYLWNNNATTQNLSNLSPGNYSLTVTDANGCSTSASVAIVQPQQLNATATITHVTCNGMNNGSVSATVNGGTGPFTYTWNNGQQSATINNLAAGVYQLTVSDVNSCTTAASFTVNQPAVLVATASTLPYACANKPGGVTLSVSGGTTPYTFAWSNNATTQNIQNLNAGNYSVTVTDAKGCTVTQQATVPSIPAISITVTKTDVICNGASTGSATVSVSGGTSPYSYLWNTNAVTPSIQQVSAGNYNVTVTDANGCTSTEAVTITQPASIQITPSATHISCHGQTDGQISVNVSGGVGPYQFAWSNAVTSQNINNLSAGTYQLTVTDANACQHTSQPITIAEPAPLAVNSVVTPVGCSSVNDGAIVLSVSGGTSPYSFNWSIGQNTNKIENLTVGNYSATVTDVRGCTALVSATVTQSPPIVVNFTKGNTSCMLVENGWVDLQVSGGTPPFQFVWNSGATTEDLSGLRYGQYSVTITDARNCTYTNQFSISYDYEINLQVTEPATINLGESITLTATANVDHGNVYQWQPAIGLSCYQCASTEASPVFNTQYTVTVQDTNGCSAIATTSVSVNSVTDLFIPNAFTPNNDGNNDVLKLYGDVNTIKFLNFKVFNRWGELVYETNDHYFAWDGKYKGEPLEPGTYIYMLNVVFINGYARDDYKGSITLLR
ncbi:MAG: gliding motility-associated C-terminal domain-containing protein [Chitinophagales bacterium]|nr:gliding motility-associated C-terminal domain-containing protein [Chitinophagales bacterium]